MIMVQGKYVLLCLGVRTALNSRKTVRKALLISAAFGAEILHVRLLWLLLLRYFEFYFKMFLSGQVFSSSVRCFRHAVIVCL